MSWQLIMADLALLLFVCTLAGLAGAYQSEPEKSACNLQFAQSQALYRVVPGVPPIGKWLAEQPHDPRARLTIFGLYRTEDHDQITSETLGLEQAAIDAGASPRTVIEPADRNQIFASLAFDGEMPPAAGCLSS